MGLQYTFSTVPLKRHREGLTPELDVRELIREHAGRGFEFVQAIPFESAPSPHLELVFVRKEQ